MIVKNDIRSLPFQLISATVDEQTSQLMTERLQALRGVVESSNKRKLKSYVKDAEKYFESEAGSDGIEEYVKEAVNLVDAADVELDEDQISECKLEARKKVVESFVASNGIGLKYTWVLPQLTAKVGSWEAVRGTDGKYNGKDTVVLNCKDDLFNRGVWYTLQYAKRSELILGSDVRLYRVGEYNNLVPLILNAFKTYQNISYSSWSPKNLNFVVDFDLLLAMQAILPEMSHEEIIQLRNDGLAYKTGDKKGVIRNPQTSSMLYGIKEHPRWGPILGDQPRLALVMLAQIWCAHPSNRTHHMILDPSNWDVMPIPLISVEPILKVHTSKLRIAADGWI